MKVLTANRLLDGEAVWYAAEKGWIETIDGARPAGGGATCTKDEAWTSPMVTTASAKLSNNSRKGRLRNIDIAAAGADAWDRWRQWGAALEK